MLIHTCCMKIFRVNQHWALHTYSFYYLIIIDHTKIFPQLYCSSIACTNVKNIIKRLGDTKRFPIINSPIGELFIYLFIFLVYKTLGS